MLEVGDSCSGGIEGQEWGVTVYTSFGGKVVVSDIHDDGAGDAQMPRSCSKLVGGSEVALAVR